MLCLCHQLRLQNNFSVRSLKYFTGQFPWIVVYRTLLSDSTTKLEHYKRQRIFRLDYLQHKGKVDLFEILSNIRSFEEVRQNVPKIMDATHCAQTSEDCQIVENVLKILMSGTESESKDFAFGANVIRMYHYLQMPDEAYTFYESQDFRDMAKDNTCHLLLIDLLYKHGQYSKAVEVFFNMEKFNINCSTLAVAALYHINTLESLNTSQALLIHMSTNYAVSRRTVLFAAMHAFNQGKSSLALQTLQFCKQDTVARNIELMCLCRLQRLQDVLSHLDEILQQTDDISKLWSLRIYSDAWNEVLEVIESHGNDKEMGEFENMKKELKLKGVLSRQLTKVFLEWTIAGDIDYRKERAKRILHRKHSELPP